LERYVEIKGNQVSAKIRDTYISNSIQIEKTERPSIPKKVTAICSEIITDLVYLEKDVVILYGGPIDEKETKEVEDPVGMKSFIKVNYALFLFFIFMIYLNLFILFYFVF